MIYRQIAYAKFKKKTYEKVEFLSENFGLVLDIFENVDYRNEWDEERAIRKFQSARETIDTPAWKFEYLVL